MQVFTSLRLAAFLLLAPSAFAARLRHEQKAVARSNPSTTPAQDAVSAAVQAWHNELAHRQQAQTSKSAIPSTSTVYSFTDPVSVQVAQNSTQLISLIVGDSTASWQLEGSTTGMKYVLMTTAQLGEHGVPDAATWTPTASNHVAKYSCTSDCAEADFTTTDLDKTTNYALFGLNTNNGSANSTTVTGDITSTQAYSVRTVPMFIESQTVAAGASEVIAGMMYTDSMSVTLHVSPSAGADMKFYILRADQFTKALLAGDTTLATVTKAATATCTACTSVTLSATGLGVVQSYLVVAVNEGAGAATVTGINAVMMTKAMVLQDENYSETFNVDISYDVDGWPGALYSPVAVAVLKDSLSWSLSSTDSTIQYALIDDSRMEAFESYMDGLNTDARSSFDFGEHSCLSGCATFAKSNVALDINKFYTLYALNMGKKTGTVTGTFTVKYKATESIATSSDTTKKTDEKTKSSCFSGRDTLQLRDGRIKPFATLAVGDEILTLSEAGTLEYSPVVYLPHAHNDAPAAFVEIVLEGGKQTLRMTPDHLVANVEAHECTGMMQGLVTGASMSKHLTLAGRVNASDCVFVANGQGGISLHRVQSTTTVADAGIYTAITKNPYLVVNGVIASPFALLHDLPDTLYTLVRMLYTSWPSAVESQWLQTIMGGMAGLADSILPVAKQAGLISSN